jgi:hypothetical protein
MRNERAGKRRWPLWVLATAIATGVPAALPVAGFAQEDPQTVREDRVPPEVLQAARRQILDSQDVVYRKQGGTYIINFTTASNLRLQTRVRENGELVQPAELAPNQPDNAPNRAERARLLTEWQQRVAAQQVPPPPMPVPPGQPVPPQPVPPTQPPVGQPPLPGQPPIPTPVVPTQVQPSALPAPVLGSLDRFTAGSRDISYYETHQGDVMRYEARYTHSDGTRREVVVNNGGNLIAGPLVISEQATDQELEADRPDAGQPTRITPIAAADVPATAQQTLGRYVPRDAVDIRYRRDTLAGGASSIGVHWVLPQNGKRYWMAVNDNGDVLTPPRLSSFQPAPAEREGVRSLAVRREAVPERVRTAMDAQTRGAREAQYFQQLRDGRTFYGVEWTAADGRRMWLRTDATGNTVAGPVVAETGRAAVNERAAIPAAAGVEREAIPAAVQATITTRTQGGRNVETVRRTEGGRTVYFTTWTDASGDSHQMRLDEQGRPIVQDRR